MKTFPQAWTSGWRRALRIAALSLGVALVAYGSLAFYADVPANEGIWLANGVLLAILLVNPRRDWPWFLAINFLLNTAAHRLFFFASAGTRFSLGISLAYSLLNIVEVGLAAVLISRKVKGNLDIARLSTMGWIAFYGFFVACAVSTLLATLMALVMDPFSRNYFQVKWYFSEALGMAIMTPLILAVHMDDLRSIIARRKVLETIGLLTLVAATSIIVFGQDEFPVSFLLFPVLLLVMFRLGTTGSAAAVFLVSIPAIYYTLHGRGPFMMVKDGTFSATVVVLYAFIAVLVSMVYVVAGALAGRRRLEIELRQSEGNFRVLAEHSQDMIVRTGLDGRARYLSPSVAELTGWNPADLIGCSFRDLVHPEHKPVFDQMWQSLAASRFRQVATYPLKLKTGSYLWVEANARLVSDPATGQAREVVSVIRDVSERVADQQQLIQAYREAEVLVTTDPLTGLTNRRGFDETLSREWRLAVGARSAISLLMVDLDYFKTYNDLYGHLAGDDCLRTVAKTLKHSLFRPADLPARFGGDEFAVLLPSTPIEGASEIADRLRAALAELELEPEPGRLVQVSASIGCACVLPAPDDDPRLLLMEADKNLYHVKRARDSRG
jgi:diguanylate cyclase (GGDEF)-like protein/PAS domain S-box-containing protein